MFKNVCTRFYYFEHFIICFFTQLSISKLLYVNTVNDSPFISAVALYSFYECAAIIQALLMENNSNNNNNNTECLLSATLLQVLSIAWLQYDSVAILSHL